MNLTQPAARPRRGHALAWAMACALGMASPVAWGQGAAAEQVQVRRFQVQGNTLIDAAAVQAALAPHTGARTLADLQKAAQAVQALYGQAGWAAVVVLPKKSTSRPCCISLDHNRGTTFDNLDRFASFMERNVRRLSRFHTTAPILAR